MSDIISVIKKLPEMEYIGPVSEEAIRSIEKELNVQFADDYKKYLLAFGAVDSDIIALSGIGDTCTNVLELTHKARSCNEHIPLNFYVIEDAGVDGLIIWQDETEAVYQSVPLKEPQKIYNNLSEYLEYVFN